MALRLLEFEHRARLASSLAKCGAMSDLGSRRSIVRQLSFGADVEEDSTANHHSLKIVEQCCSHERGFEQLLDALLGLPDLDEFYAGLQEFFPQPVTWAQCSMLKNLIGKAGAAICDPVLAYRLYGSSVGNAVAPPSIPNDANVLFWLIDDLGGRATRQNRPLLAFVNQLREVLPGEYRGALDTWIGELAITEKTKAAPNISTLSVETRAFLLIKVAPGPKDAYVVCGWMLRKDFQCLEISSQMPVTINNLCATLKEFRKAALDRALDVPSNELAIEIFLPDELLDCNFDDWIIELRKPITLRVLTHHPVVLRSLWRTYDPEVIRESRGLWLQKWKGRPTAPKYLDSDRLYLAPSKSDSTSLYEKLGDKLVLVALSSLVNCDPMHAGEAITALLLSGTPIALWPRSKNTDPVAVESELKKLLCCNDFESIPDLLRVLRKNAHSGQDATNLWHNVVLLWDDPLRIPPESPIARYRNEE